MRHTLLLADDSVTIQRVIELTFADEDVDVIAVSDGDQAIAHVEASPPDIVLADIGMPGKNGYEVARYIKQSPRLAHIPVLLLTGAFEPVDQARAAEAGCDGILAKPFEPQLVIGRVKELLTKESGSAPRPVDAPTPSVSTASNEDLGEYFDRLDAAFANLSSARSPAPTPAPAEPEGQVAGLPPIADAFAALLAAEQRERGGGDGPLWPGNVQAAAPQITEDVIEQIVRRVLARLSDQVVRQTVADIVSATAERLVREEIDRIKGAIK